MSLRRVRMIMESVKALHDNGTVPPGVENPAFYRMRAGGALVPEGVNGLEMTRDVIYAKAEALVALQ